ncbi:MAG: hypothetical protein IT255_07260, partial [Chitinophagaceae bacterium]|nr:hypothetical protein [Chitinophagaceae bacterium]
MKQNLQNKICLLALALLLCQAAGFAQVNTWTKVTTKQIGSWFYPAMAYSAGTKEYIVTMGWQDNFGQNGVYTVQSYQHKNGKWINSLPHDSLYGKWANLTGPAYGNGRTEDNVFGTPWWAFRTIDGYLRPSIGTVDGPYTYNQYCYNTDDGKIYYYVHDVTFTYDPASRLWDTLTVISQPTVGNPYNTGNQFDFSHYLKFGAMCYDGYNKEIVLFGGTGVENSTGSPGTWTFKPSTKTWSKLNLPLQPEPVAFSAMVYDPDNKVIVLFGGDRLDKLKNDTWIYNCITKTWTKKNPAIRPSPRQGHAMLFFPKSRKIVLAGGNNYSGNIPELWTYNVGLNTWQLIKRDNPATSLINYSEGQIQIMSLNCAVDKGDTLIVLADSAYRANGYHFTPQTYRMVCDASVVDAAGTTTYGLTSDTVIYL